jgi:putative FmdB family regulatory protein
MPTYVYACDGCGKGFEKFQSFKDAPLQTCPHCSQDTIRRVFQPVGIVFKGSGWYITDSRNATNASLTDTSTNANTSTNASTSTSDTSESKDAPTPAATTTTSETKTSSSD